MNIASRRGAHSLHAQEKPLLPPSSIQISSRFLDARLGRLSKDAPPCLQRCLYLIHTHTGGSETGAGEGPRAKTSF
eukprot:8087497-Pyramimonas_sp.AAC.1